MYGENGGLEVQYSSQSEDENPATLGEAEYQELYGSDQFEVVALSVDLKGAEASAAFLKEIKADNLALYVDKTTKAMRKLGAIGLPLTVLDESFQAEVVAALDAAGI